MKNVDNYSHQVCNLIYCHLQCTGWVCAGVGGRTWTTCCAWGLLCCFQKIQYVRPTASLWFSKFNTSTNLKEFKQLLGQCSPLRSIQNSIQTVYSTGCTHINQETIHILEMFNPSAMELETLDAKKSIFYHRMMCNTKLIFNLYFCDLHNQLDTGKVILGPSSFSLTGPRLRCY